MQGSNNNALFIPPPEGGGDWLSFFAFPFNPFSINGISAWFERFAGMSGPEVRYLLQHDWRDIGNPSLGAFANALLKFYPVGVLKSLHEDWGNAAWIVLSRWAPSQELVDAVLRRARMDDLLYLAAPRAVPSGWEIESENLVLTFFLRFGGLRCSPPFTGGFFFDFPTSFIEVYPGEREKWSRTPWENASVLFEDNVGDQLVLSVTGDVGWLLHDTREIIPKSGGFAGVLTDLVKSGGRKLWKFGTGDTP